VQGAGLAGRVWQEECTELINKWHGIAIRIFAILVYVFHVEESKATSEVDALMMMLVL